ncbi:MAG: DUF4878 domain-containing protein [Chloracidobacterium sp.]|nr:DUF4878 domain-containing protein [Chloracidobacterium sp.]
MRIWSIVLIFSFAAFLTSCGEQQPATPLETYKTYTKAIKRKDTAAMKLLLSEATIKMNEQEATAQGVSVDDIVKRETLFIESQKSVEYRDEKIDGDKATLQVKNSFGSWETVPFVREEGVWKIDKLGQANQMMKDILNRQKQAFGDEGTIHNKAFGEDVDDSAPIEEMPKGE